MRRPRSFALILTVLCAVPALAAEPALRFDIAGKTRAERALPALKAELSIREIEVMSHPHGHRKNFRAFPLHEILDLAFGSLWKDEKYSEVAFEALDGYIAIARIDTLKKKGGYIAFEDLDVKGWEPVGRKKTNPGPFFLVWSETRQDDDQKFPWPYQLRALNLIRFEDQYPAVVPKNTPKGSAVDRGYRVFRTRCVKCHAIDQDGGKMGPDLNSPKSIVEYRSRKFLKAFIPKPSTFRFSQMPEQKDISPRDLDDLLSYFEHKSRERTESW